MVAMLYIHVFVRQNFVLSNSLEIRAHSLHSLIVIRYNLQKHMVFFLQSNLNYSAGKIVYKETVNSMESSVDLHQSLKQ